MPFFFPSYSVANEVVPASHKDTLSITSERKNIVKQDALLDNKASILTIVRTAAISYDKDTVLLLKKFQNKPDDIKLVHELFVKKYALHNHLWQQLDNGEDNLGIAVTIEALSLINSASAMSFLVSNKYNFIDDTDLNIYILKLLRELPPSENISAYLSKLLTIKADDDLLVRNVLLAMASYEMPDKARWVAYYRSPGIDPDIRFIGLYLSSLQSKDEVLQGWILDALFDKNKPPPYQHYYLLVALSRQMSNQQFNDFLSRSYVNSDVIASVMLEREFYNGSNEQRKQLAMQLVNSRYSDQRISAISFLLQHQGFKKTWQQLNQQQRLSAIRLSYKLGIAVVIEATNIENEAMLSQRFYMPLVVLLSLLCFVLFWKRRDASASR